VARPGRLWRPRAALGAGAPAVPHTYPKTGNVDKGLLAAAIEEALACFQTCTACADACLSEDMVAELTKCIRTNQDCATTCAATVEVLSRHTGHDANITQGQLLARIAACKACADECEQHAQMHEHCRICAEACRRCEQACQALLDSIS
jgi:hypothetical protein